MPAHRDETSSALRLIAGALALVLVAAVGVLGWSLLMEGRLWRALILAVIGLAVASPFGYVAITGKLGPLYALFWPPW